MANRIKGLVSKNKRRFQSDGYDLDLSYILPSVIAMGFPAEKLQGVFRNHIEDVVSFLEHYHKGNYRIYNLCSERAYDKTRFHGAVEDFPFEDHHPPRFEIIGKFCVDVQDWLTQDPNHVAVVHCKAGKGRTGVMICAFLLHSNQCADADAALKLYGNARTMDEKGVTIPSQRRYVHYYSYLLQNKLTYKPVTLRLHAIKLEPMPLFSNSAISYVVRWYADEPSSSTDGKMRRSLKQTVGDNRRPKKSDDRPQTSLLISLKRPLSLIGDVCIEFYSKPKMMKKEKMFHFWFNTFFTTDREVCRLADIDSDDNDMMQSALNEPCAPSQSEVVAEAHRMRERLNSQWMDSVKQLQHEEQPVAVVDDVGGEAPESPWQLDVGRQVSVTGNRVQVENWQRKLSTSSVSSNRPVAYRTLTLEKCNIDKANKDKQHKSFAAEFKVKLFLTSPEDRQPHDSGSGSSQLQPQSLCGPLSPEGAASESGMAALSDVEDDEDMTEEGDELSDTDDEVWQTASSLQQTRI